MHGANQAPEQFDRFEVLYRNFYQDIYRYVLRRINSDADTAADLVAEVFVVALRRQDAIPDPPDDRLWLFGVARRVVLGDQRGRTRRLRLQSRLQSRLQAEDACARESHSDPAVLAVRDAVQELRPIDREALRLVAWDGLSHAEAAQVLGCSTNAIALRIHKVKARLRVSIAAPRPQLSETRSQK